LLLVYAARHEVEAEEAVGPEVVEEAPGLVVAVAEAGVGKVGLDGGEGLPLLDPIVGGVVVLLGFGLVAGEVGDLCCGFEADDAFQREVGLVGEFAGEVVWIMSVVCLLILDGNSFTHQWRFG
jgi:hypothetical protein